MEGWIWLMSRSALITAVVVVLVVAILRPILKPLPMQPRLPHKPESMLESPAPSAPVAGDPNSPAPEGAGLADGAAVRTGGDSGTQPSMDEMIDGENLEQFRDRLRQAAAQNKSAITADMLSMANSYDDKVALMRLLVSENSSRVANALKKMMRE